MLTKKILSAIGFIFVLSSCSTSPSVDVNFDKNQKVDILKYQTFAWLTADKVIGQPAGFNPIMKERIDDAIEQSFIKKGYILVDSEDKADFTISYTLGSRDKLSVNSYPTTYHTAGVWGRRYYGGVAMGTETTVRQYTEGRLAIDVFDVKTKQAAWHGWATKRISSSKNQKDTSEQVVQDIVDQVLVNFL